ncbi:hypothetical protein AB0L40_20215 [Patulibacter sp. NPDC049589]|uniref:hypothetical protein n=1 Tax=Patulibacter sp. NPDC049589 TaxID=3154731 RepID=UPI00344181DB
MDHHHLRATATASPYLRGLVAVPGGLLFVVAALGNWGWGPLRHPAAFLVVVACVAAACAVAGRYTRERVGRATPTRAQRVREGLVGVAGVALMVGGSTLLRSRASWSLDLPVNAIPAMFAVHMLLYYEWLVGLRAHHRVVWGLLLAAGAFPVWDGADPSNVGLVLTGVAVSINGALDHRLLLRDLDPPAWPATGADRAG